MCIIDNAAAAAAARAGDRVSIREEGVSLASCSSQHDQLRLLLVAWIHYGRRHPIVVCRPFVGAPTALDARAETGTDR